MYKPSPLSMGSPRSSPFRRPESPAMGGERYAAQSTSQSPSSPSRPSVLSGRTSPTKLHQQEDSRSLGRESQSRMNVASSTASSPQSAKQSSHQNQQLPPSSSSSNQQNRQYSYLQNQANANTTLSQIAPPLLEQLRQSFSYLDRSANNTLSHHDIAMALSDMGMSNQPADMAAFFDSGDRTRQITLAQYLANLAGTLSQFSHTDELVNALAAFDENDDGEISKDLLVDALTCPGKENALTRSEVDNALAQFTAKQKFGKQSSGDRGDVIRYREWLGEITGQAQTVAKNRS